MDKEVICAGILGGVVADALGVPYEFKSYRTMQEYPALGMRGYGTYNQPEGTWSDDSSMTLALMDSLINGIDYTDMIEKFCDWFLNAKYTPLGDVFDFGKILKNSYSSYFKNIESNWKNYLSKCKYEVIPKVNVIITGKEPI